MLDHCGDFTHLPGEYAKWDDVAGYSRDIRDLASGLMCFALSSFGGSTQIEDIIYAVCQKTIVDFF